MTGHPRSAIDLLQAAAAEYSEIHRAKHYGFWRQDSALQLRDALAELAPFRDFRSVWIYTGDGGCVAATPRFGEWAIDRMVERMAPDAIVAAFADEVARNVALYEDISPVFGVKIDARCELGEGVALVPQPADIFEAGMVRVPLHNVPLPAGTATLCQAFTVTPAFEQRPVGETARADGSVTVPDAQRREALRTRVRLACLLASAGAVELPLTALRPDRGALFVTGEGNQMDRPFAAHPLVSFPVEAVAVARAYAALERFREIESLARAIDRLGRARLAASSVDRALELGIAAEIALMHDHSPANTEITHKIGSRAAWLLGQDAAERETIFADMKKLYQARSQAAHSGTLSSRVAVDLDAADGLVARALLAILERGAFPDWTRLTLGADAEAASTAPS